jgi:hypothetical protein
MTGLIRKIIIGQSPKDALAYFVGMKAGSGKVSDIVLDEQYLEDFGKTRYLVYLSNEEGTSLWKAIEEMPCLIEFDLNF